MKIDLGKQIAEKFKGRKTFLKPKAVKIGIPAEKFLGKEMKSGKR